MGIVGMHRILRAVVRANRADTGPEVFMSLLIHLDTYLSTLESSGSLHVLFGRSAVFFCQRLSP